MSLKYHFRRSAGLIGFSHTHIDALVPPFSITPAGKAGKLCKQQHYSNSTTITVSFDGQTSTHIPRSLRCLPAPDPRAVSAPIGKSRNSSFLSDRADPLGLVARRARFVQDHHLAASRRVVFACRARGRTHGFPRSLFWAARAAWSI